MRRVDGRGVLEAQGRPARMKAGEVGNEELLEGLGCGSTVAFQEKRLTEMDKNGQGLGMTEKAMWELRKEGKKSDGRRKGEMGDGRDVFM